MPLREEKSKDTGTLGVRSRWGKGRMGPFPHKYIRNTSARGAVLTEHLVNIGRTFSRFPKGKKSPFNCEGQNKEKREKGIRTGAMTGERFLALGSPVPGGEVSGDRGRALESQRARHLVYRGQRRDRPAQMVSTATRPSPV